ncbi:restriction endonuclease subunit S [Campylobacter coli]|nr:restriction endonuclease subunit S [Campylobacter coli]EAL3273745.1 restriction endonuclease subunit S [Campylobacter coli]EAO7118994.1 restriction endonuclease subunit S [Campylobacter coli]EAO7119280.1 restriction endonuclease subunit S [Campylobacter coli]EBF5467722.1 restriction endonuclease subunit S [Campylobacter coli]
MKIKIWKINKLEKICEILDNKRVPISQKDRISGIYPYYGASGIVDYIDKYIFDEELVLIGEDGAKWDAFENSAFIASGKYWVNNHAHILKPNNEILINKFLVYFLNYSNLEKYITGATVKKLNQQKLKQIEIPLPPLKEQERIVGILDESIKILEQDLLNLDELMQSALQKAFNPLKDNAKENYKLPQGWEWKSLGEIANTSSGGTPSRNKKEYWENGNIKWLKSGELNDGYIDFIEENITEEAIKNSSAKIFQKGTLLIAMYGATAGKLGILNLDSTTNQAICAFLHKDKNIKFLEKFLFYFLFFLRDKIIKDSFGGAQPNINQTYIKNLQIPLPPIKEQEQIAKHLDFVFEKTKALKELYTKELKDYEELKQSLLNKAFKGEL